MVIWYYPGSSEEREEDTMEPGSNNCDIAASSVS
jgi:hypothetical protein